MGAIMTVKQQMAFRATHTASEVTDVLDLLAIVQHRLQEVGELEAVGQSVTVLHVAAEKLAKLRALSW